MTIDDRSRMSWSFKYAWIKSPKLLKKLPYNKLAQTNNHPDNCLQKTSFIQDSVRRTFPQLVATQALIYQQLVGVLLVLLNYLVQLMSLLNMCLRYV